MSTSSNLESSLGAWAKTFLGAMQTDRLDDATVGKLAGAFATAQQALIALEQAKANAAAILEQSAGAASAKIADAQALVQQAADAATAALNALDATAKRVRDQIAAKVMPAKPAGVDPQALDRRVHDLRDVIVARGGQQPDLLLKAAADLLQQALDQDDQLGAFVMAREQDLWLESRDVLPAAWLAARAQALGSRQQADGSPIAGARTLALLDQGGPNTMQGFLAMARYVVYNQATDFQAYVKRRIGLVKDNPQWSR